MMPRSSSPEATVDPAVAEGFRDLMAAWPTGISVVTSAEGATPVGCTVTALVSVSTDPPLLLVSLATSGRTLAVVREYGRFGVCALSAAQRQLGRAFATGRPAQRFAGVGYGWVGGVPVLRGCATAMVCAVADLLPVADHVLVLGRPLWQARDAGAAPAVWYRRACWTLRPPGPA